jgi:hypothetical protein
MKIKLTKEQAKEIMDEKLSKDLDFVDSPRYKNSIKYLLQSKPDGVENKAIGKMLHMSEEEVEEAFQNGLRKLREIMKIHE